MNLRRDIAATKASDFGGVPPQSLKKQMRTTRRKRYQTNWLANKHQTNKETGDVSIPAKLKNYADRLRREFHSLN